MFIRMVECPAGIHGESARKFSGVAKSANAGQEIIEKIREIDAALDRLKEVEKVYIASTGNCCLNLPVDSDRVRNYALTCMSLDRGELVAKFNRLYSSGEK